MSSLTRSATDRVFIGGLSLVFAPACAYCLYVRLSESPSPAEQQDWAIALFAGLLTELVGSVFLVSVFGLTWAVWLPAKTERLLRGTFWHFVALIFMVGLIVRFILTLV